MLKEFIGLKNRPDKSKEETLAALKKGKEDLMALKR